MPEDKPKQGRTAGRKSPMLSVTMPPEYFAKLDAIQAATDGATDRSATIRHLIDKSYKTILRRTPRTKGTDQ